MTLAVVLQLDYVFRNGFIIPVPLENVKYTVNYQHGN